MADVLNHRFVLTFLTGRGLMIASIDLRGCFEMTISYFFILVSLMTLDSVE